MNELFSDIESAEDEVILWEGKPQQPVGIGMWWKLYIMTLVAGGLLLWSFTGPVPEGAAEIHEFISAGFSRIVLGFLFLASAAGPSLNARSTNESCYRITNKRILIHRGFFRGKNCVSTYDWEDVFHVSITPMHNGLASVTFLAPSATTARTQDTNTMQELLHAIPATTAEDIKALAAEARA